MWGQFDLWRHRQSRATLPRYGKRGLGMAWSWGEFLKDVFTAKEQSRRFAIIGLYAAFVWLISTYLMPQTWPYREHIQLVSSLLAALLLLAAVLSLWDWLISLYQRSKAQRLRDERQNALFSFDDDEREVLQWMFEQRTPTASWDAGTPPIPQFNSGVQKLVNRRFGYRRSTWFQLESTIWEQISENPALIGSQLPARPVAPSSAAMSKAKQPGTNMPA
jgi:hypothetical protein